MVECFVFLRPLGLRLIDLRNQADNLAYSVEKMLGENRAKVSESEAKNVEDAIAEARKAAQGDDGATIKAAMDRLTKASHKLAEELYRQAGPGPSAGPAAGPPPGSGEGQAPPPQGDVVDAEYTVKGDNPK